MKRYYIRGHSWKIKKSYIRPGKKYRMTKIVSFEYETKEEKGRTIEAFEIIKSMGAEVKDPPKKEVSDEKGIFRRHL